MKTVSESKESDPAGEQSDGEFQWGWSDYEKEESEEESISDAEENMDVDTDSEKKPLFENDWIPVEMKEKKWERKEEEDWDEGDLDEDPEEYMERMVKKSEEECADSMDWWMKVQDKQIKKWRAQLAIIEKDKPYSSCLVDIERNYVSVAKRYPRLYVSQEFFKVVVNWPRENLKIPFNTPVSFPLDFIEEEMIASTTVMMDDPAKLERASTQWNAKMILMSGLSQDDLEELSSERSYDECIPHLCNMLRFAILEKENPFAILKKENSFMAIGGPWDSIDGADPSVDNSSLVQTALRYANGVKLDLKNCQHWNPFLEIHYDRLGKDGLFSHKEITVLYVPDLSECLPSVDAWRDQWFANKKAIAESKSRDMKENKRREEPPRDPRLFLQTKGSKDSKLHLLSLSLDSLLDYTDTVIEESTFELYLFAETFYEMLQYQMGSRLLTFLQKLRIKFVSKRNQRKRKGVESLMTESEKASSSKSVKTEESTVENKIVNTETPDEDRLDDEKAVVKKENVEEQKLHTHAKYINVAGKKKDPQDENAMETSETKPKLEGKDGKGEKAEAKMERKKKVTPVIVDKELLLAFRFFDRYRVGYLLVEDMMLIIENLGKFMSHRDVKELVEIAQIESNTGRKNRIRYSKLVKMTDISET